MGTLSLDDSAVNESYDQLEKLPITINVNEISFSADLRVPNFPPVVL